MKTREEVLTLFRAKYDYLKSVYPQVGSFEEAASSNFYQNPDGGWQMNWDNCAAITLRPGDDEAHETHGVIGARWFQEGGAFDVNCIPGWLGYPIADVREEMEIVSPPVVLHVPESPNPLQFRIPVAVSEFEYGRVCWHCGLTWERVYEEHTEGQVFIRGGGPFAVCPGTSCFLTTNGSTHLPPDIDAAVKTFLSFRKLHVTGNMTHLCERRNDGRVTWKFNIPIDEYNEMVIYIWRVGINIRVGIEAVHKPRLFERLKRNYEEFEIPNYFKAWR